MVVVWPDGLIPFCSFIDDRRHVTVSLHVIQHCRLLKQPFLHGTRRLDSWHATVSFDGSCQCRALPAHECACALTDFQIKGKSRA